MLCVCEAFQYRFWFLFLFLGFSLFSDGICTFLMLSLYCFELLAFLEVEVKKGYCTLFKFRLLLAQRPSVCSGLFAKAFDFMWRNRDNKLAVTTWPFFLHWSRIKAAVTWKRRGFGIVCARSSELMSVIPGAFSHLAFGAKWSFIEIAACHRAWFFIFFLPIIFWIKPTWTLGKVCRTTQAVIGRSPIFWLATLAPSGHFFKK